MRQTFKLGRIAGLAVGAHWSVLVIVVLVMAALAEGVLPDAVPGMAEAAYWCVGALASLLFLGSLLAHEIAHALVARHAGVPVGSITLWGLGGLTELKGEPPSPRADLLIAVAGPVASLVAALAFAAAAWTENATGLPDLATTPLTWLVVTNVLLAAFNLLPGAPLDGGRVLRALHWARYGDLLKAERAATASGIVLGYGLVAVGLAELLAWSSGGGVWLILVGWFVKSAAMNERLSATLRAEAKTMSAADLMTPGPLCGAAWKPIRPFVREAVLHSEQTFFPVVELSGAPSSFVTLDSLARVPPARAEHALGEIARPLPSDHVDGPDDPALPLLTRRPVGGELLSVVVTGDQVIGMVTTADLRRLLHRARLHETTRLSA